MFSALLLAGAAATGQVQRPPIAVAAPDLSVVNLDANRATFYTEYFSQHLSRSGLKVVTAKQISAVLGMERQRELLGCGDTSSACMAELANALGTDGILIGTVAQIGKVFQVNLSIIASADGTALTERSIRVSEEEDLLDELSRVAPEMAKEVTAKLRPDASLPKAMAAIAAPSQEAPAAPRAHGLRKWSWAPAVAAVGLGVTGAVLMNGADASYRRLEQPISFSDAEVVAQQGALQQSLAVSAFVVGGVALAAAGTMFLLPTDVAPTKVSASFSPDGAALVLTGRFP